MNALGLIRLHPSEALLLADGFELVREDEAFSLPEVWGALEAVNGERFAGRLAIETIPRLGCVEVRAGREFVREFWVTDPVIRYFPHQDDTVLSTWLLHQLGHRAAEKLGATPTFDHAAVDPDFHRAYASPRDFIDRAPDAAGWRHLRERRGARQELASALATLPAGMRERLG